VPTQVLTGSYQLEIRRGAEYGISDNGPLNGINAKNTQTPIVLLDTNDRLIPDQRTGAAIPIENFESGNFTKLPWNFTDDAPWTVSSSVTNPNGGTISAASGKIVNGQSSGLSIDLITGSGNLTFSRAVDSEQGFDFLKLYIDGRLANYTEINGIKLASPLPAIWSGTIDFETITVPVSAGHHNFRWTYDKDSSDPAGSTVKDQAYIDDIRFPSPQVGVQNIYEDPSLHQSTNPNAVTPPISPTIAPPASFSQIHFIDTLLPGFTRGGDTNGERQQGHIQIEMNQIYAASQVGILIDSSRQGNLNPSIGSLRNLPTLSTDRLVPGVTVSNNIVSNSGLVGIQFNGDANTAVNGQAVPVAAVPFGRIVNNTVYGGDTRVGTGILVKDNAGPTLLNNIVANTNLGISVDSTSTSTTVLGANLYSNNTANVPTGASVGSNPILLAPNAPLFVDAAHQNFYPAKNSLAIDSALNTLADRPSIVAVKSAIGIPQSPILVPDRDIYGQLRVDDPSQSPPPGLGNNVFKERGAVERADFLNPTASMLEPLDNDNNSPFRDRNRAPNDLAIRNEDLERFVVKLSDDGVGIDDFTVDHNKFTLTVDGVVLIDDINAAALGVSPDYQFVYNPATDQAIFTPSSGIWAKNHTYRITINNNPVGATDSLGNPLPAGIFDLAGNPLAANRATGEVSFSIFVGTLYDFGDAPSNLPNQHYATTLADNGAAHVVQDGYYLGSGISEEPDALQNATATADGDDPVPPANQFSDGITFLGNPAPSKTTTIVNTMTVVAHLPVGMTSSKLDVWFDLNRDGDWLDPGEKIILTNTSHPGSSPNDIFDGTNTFTYTFGDSLTAKGATFGRFRLSPNGVSRPDFVIDPITGQAPDGEVEDKQIFITGAPFQNPKTNFPGNQLDVNDDGVISATDVLIIINFINAKGSGPLVLGQPPIPNPALGPGVSLYVDVNGDSSMDGSDVLAIINFLNSQKSTNGEAGSFGGEGEDGSSTSFVMTTTTDTVPTASNSAASNLVIPPVLLASPSVVFEVRDSGPVATLAAAQSATRESAEDHALLAFDATDSANESLAFASKSKTNTLIDSADEESWEDLLGSLAADQKANT